MEERPQTSVRDDGNYQEIITDPNRLDGAINNFPDKRNVRRVPRVPSERIRRIQKIVGATEDGYNGPETRRKIAEFQRKLGVKADGKWGRETENAYLQTQKMQRVPESEERQAISRGLMEDVDTVGRTDLLHGQRDSDFNRYTDRSPLWTNAKRDEASIQQIVGAKVDGKYGPETKRKVAEWQRAHGLKADGLWGSKTEAAYQAEQRAQSERQMAPERKRLNDEFAEQVKRENEENFNKGIDKAYEQLSPTPHDQVTSLKTFEDGYDENFSRRRRKKELRNEGVDWRTARRQARWEKKANNAQREAERNGYKRTSNTEENLEYVTKDGRKVYYHGRANGGSIDLAKLKFL